jgi:hypothetical protein
METNQSKMNDDFYASTLPIIMETVQKFTNSVEKFKKLYGKTVVSTDDDPVDNGQSSNSNLRQRKTSNSSNTTVNNNTTNIYYENSDRHWWMWFYPGYFSHPVYNQTIYIKKDSSSKSKKKNNSDEDSTPKDGTPIYIFITAMSAIAIFISTYIAIGDDYVIFLRSMCRYLFSEIRKQTKDTPYHQEVKKLKIKFMDWMSKFTKRTGNKFFSKIILILSLALLCIMIGFPFFGYSINFLPTFLSIVGITGSGCYYLWNDTMDTEDEYKSLQSLIMQAQNLSTTMGNDWIFHQGPSNDNQIPQPNLYPSCPTYGEYSQFSAPIDVPEPFSEEK